MITEKQKFKYALIFPFMFLFAAWSIEAYEQVNHLSFAHLGVEPLTLNGLLGILLAPLLHGDWNHLISNTVSFAVLAPSVFYFYRGISFNIFTFIYITSGLGVWLFGRPYYHIGLSGVIYGLASFLFFSGVMRKNTHLLAISMLVIFLYGSMVWGMFPMPNHISWEAHLAGFSAGAVLAVLYRKQGPLPDADPFEGEDEWDEVSVFEEADEQLAPPDEPTPPTVLKVYYKANEPQV